MADPWANLTPAAGPELQLDLAGLHGRARLETALRTAVRTGRLRTDTRLPSSRTLAADLGVARNTVAEAYTQLVAEGWLEARVGSGTWVAERPRTTGPAEPAAEPAAEPVGPRLRYDLRTGTPDLSLFPRTAWVGAVRRSLVAAPNEALGNGDPRGRPELRQALATYLSRARGVQVGPDRVVVCSGFTQALGLLARVVADRSQASPASQTSRASQGSRQLAVEAYGHPGYRDVIAHHGLTPVDLRLDEQGAVIEELGPVGGVLLTPAHQFPLGMALAAARRNAVSSWAQDSGGIVIEDDYDGEFRYDRAALGAMQALAPEHVVYAGTASKSLAPALRLSWLVLPQAWLDDVVSAKLLADRFTGAIDQLALADLIESGGYDRHIRRCRLVYRRRRDRLVAALARRAPAVRVSGLAAGLHAVVDLPPGLAEPDVVEQVAARGVAVEGLAEYRPDGSQEPDGRSALVVGYATPPEHAFTAAVARLVAALESISTPGPTGRSVRDRRSRPGSAGLAGRARP